MANLLTKQQLPVLVARLVEFQEKFNILSSEDGQFVIQNTTEAIELFIEAIKNRKRAEAKKVFFLKLFSGSEELKLKASDGKAIIYNANKTFKSYIDSDFIKWELNSPGKATEATSVDVYEMIKDGNFSQLFLSLNADLDKLVMTQAQIIEFCEAHPDWLRQEGYATFFLIKENEEYFVVHVRVYPDGLHVLVGRFENDGVWRAGYVRRLVVPQLKPLAT
ncbi:MAG: hypothetical protein WCX80_04300 [Patescibacteria group bacterium]|jgi:hypothetical protein